MTDDQLKWLAAMVIHDNERLDLLSQTVNNLIERAADSGDDFEGRANKLRSGAEQLSAFFEREALRREEMRKVFGLPQEND